LISPDDLVARLRRLEALARGLARELALWQDAGSPLLYPERKAYLDAVRDTRAGVEKARVALAQACQRLGKS
jgi:hypothetical protein